MPESPEDALEGADIDGLESAVPDWGDHRAGREPVARQVLRSLPVDHIYPNPRQPRSNWEANALEELTRSIVTQGLLEPILVRPVGGERYEIVAGERRWRACKAAGWKEIPALVRSMKEQESLEAALIENIQRSNLSPIEEARAYGALAREFGLTHEEIARRVSKDRSTVTNLLRVLSLPDEVLAHVGRGALTVGHARVLLSVPEEYQMPMAERMAHEEWSVRKAESWARGLAKAGGTSKRRPPRGEPKPESLFRLEEQLCRHFGTEVRLRVSRKGGKLEVAYYDDEDLSRLLDLMGIVVP